MSTLTEREWSCATMLCTMGWVTSYTAEIRLVACSDRALIEQGKGSGRLQQKNSQRPGPQDPFDSRDEMSNSAQRISHINTLSVLIKCWGDVKAGKDRCYTKPSRRFRQILPGALAERREALSKLHFRSTSCIDVPPPKSKYADLAGIHLRNTTFSCQEAVWVKTIWVYVNPRVAEH
jgi:hypothetical protein